MTSPLCPMTQNFNIAKAALVNSNSFIAAVGGTAPTNTVLFFTAGTNGSILRSLIASSDDTSARTVSIYASPDNGTTNYLIANLNIAAGAGLTSGTTANVDLLNGIVLIGLPTDQGGNHIIALPSGWKLYIGVTIAAVTATRTLHIFGIGEDL